MIGPRLFKLHRFIYFKDIFTPPVLRSLGQRSRSSPRGQMSRSSNFNLTYKMKTLGPIFFKVHESQGYIQPSSLFRLLGQRERSPSLGQRSYKLLSKHFWGMCRPTDTFLVSSFYTYLFLAVNIMLYIYYKYALVYLVDVHEHLFESKHIDPCLISNIY